MSPLESYERMLEFIQPVGITGRISGVRGLTATVSDFPAPVGASCRIERRGWGVDARVVGFSAEQTLVMPMGRVTGICRGDRVVFAWGEQSVGVGEAMLGRMIDGMGRPIDGRGPIWAYAMIVHQAHPSAYVATRDPRLGAVVVETHTTSVKTGDVLPFPK